ncbi:hypothetical protein V8C44DRAFT_121068 [Trichoderma aethiopicum]
MTGSALRGGNRWISSHGHLILETVWLAAVGDPQIAPCLRKHGVLRVGRRKSWNTSIQTRPTHDLGRLREDWCHHRRRSRLQGPMVQVGEASVGQGLPRSNETFRDGRESCGLRRTDGAFMQNQRAAAVRDGRRRLLQRWTEISGIDACEAGGETRLAVACWRLASTPGILRQTIRKVLDMYVARGTHGSPACHIVQDEMDLVL